MSSVLRLIPVVLMASALAAPVSAANAPAAAPAATFQKATFAGGCFWSMESAFEGLPGVQSVVSGYSGGTKENPSYEDVETGRTGHAESVQITYDPKKISYEQLLDNYWHNIDPTEVNGQICDFGTQYRTAIFYADATQQKLAEASKHRIETTPQRFKGKIAVQIVPFTRFWPAEGYHQDFARKNPGHYQAYRKGCGRDQRMQQLWGQPGRQGE